MLRALAAALLLANLLVWTWSRGWLDGWTGAPAGGHREPERLNRQVDPERMHIVAPLAPASGAALPGDLPGDLPATAAGPAGSASRAMRAPACLDSAPLADVDAAARARDTLLAAALPGVDAARLALRSEDRPGEWILYMGRFADDEAVGRKLDELQRLPNLFRERLPADSELAPGLTLGAHPSRAEATLALERLGLRGIRTARVVQTQAPRVEHRLRLEPVETGVPARLAALDEPTLAALRFEACAPAAPGSAASAAP